MTGSRYEPSAIEEAAYERWEKSGAFAPDGDGDPYTIVIPPPNVTGALHMGHGLNLTLQDIYVRFHRMCGHRTLMLPGTDHAGIATQNVVERRLLEDGQGREDLGREAFLSQVWDWKDEYEARICGQVRRLGVSVDWSRQRFTMDEGLSAAVRHAFVTLFERGLIERGHYLVNSCPRCCTVLADDEVEHEDQAGSFWTLSYPVKDDTDRVVHVATTRPETMLGDTAVAVHPGDERYADLVGATLVLPILGREIPVIADEHVDPDFGTGAVKVTPAHDPNDHEIGLRHDLPSVRVMEIDATMTEEAGPCAGLTREEARRRVVELLKAEGRLAGVEDTEHSVGHCYRCRTVVEPWLSDQWFVRMTPLAEKALAALEQGSPAFHPSRWAKFYASWLEEPRDWCISRQIWWGHRIPVWTCAACGHESAHETDPDACPECGSDDVIQDPDVLDTWFSSALWPFSTLGWPEKSADLEVHYPTDHLVTDRGIIYFWVARMVMMGIELMGEVPFSDVTIHGTILDGQGRKMSKSLGNGIDPVAMVEEHGADAVRFSLAILTREGQDVRLAEEKFLQGRNFLNKVWNAARFVLGDASTAPTSDLDACDLALEERWLRSRLASASTEATAALQEFRTNDAAMGLYRFIWNDLCDWGLEMAKPVLRDGGAAADQRRAVLTESLDAALRMLHPFCPFLTDEVLRRMRGEDLDVSREPWPAVAGCPDAEAEADIATMQEAARAARAARSLAGLTDGTALAAAVRAPEQQAARLTRCAGLLESAAGLRDLEIGPDTARPKHSAVGVAGEMEVYVVLGEDVDLDEWRALMDKRLAKLDGGLRGIDAKLGNEAFLAKADPDVVASERDRREELVRSRDALLRNLEA